MQLRVSFQERHEHGEAHFARSTSLRTRTATPMRETIALGLNTVRQFRGETERGLRSERSYLRGEVESPSMDWLTRQFDSPEGFGEPTVRLHRPRQLSQGLWAVRDLLGFESLDVVARVKFEPSGPAEYMHSHEHSDRLVMLTSGSGKLHISPGDPRHFPRNLTRLDLEAGDVVYLSRGTVHAFQAGPDGAEALVWHCPYVVHGEPQYQTDFKAEPILAAVSLDEVLKDRLLLSLTHRVHCGTTDTTALCSELHRDRKTVEEALDRLVSLRVLVKQPPAGWRLHTTVSIEVADGKVKLTRSEDGVVASVSATLRR